MSAPDPSRGAATAAIALEAEIARLSADREVQIALRTSTIVRRARGVAEPDLSDQINRLGANVASLDAEIAGAEEALRQVRDAVIALEIREANAAAESSMERAKKNAAMVRKAAKAADEAADALGAAVASLRGALANLSAGADAGVRAADGFEMLAFLAGNLPAVVQARLCHMGVMPGRSHLVDRSAAPPSVREQMDRAIYGLLPMQGRPKATSNC